ncbi:amidohydrolase family protein [Candidatus Latescibacterota bacterium]
MITDTHLHVWSGDYDRYPFAEGRKASEPAPLELLDRIMGSAGVERAVIVQPIHYLYDNRYVAECRRRRPGRLAAIGLIDQQAPDAPEQLEQLVAEEGFGGLRIHLASRVAEPAEWSAPDQDPLWRKAEELGTCFCVHGPCDHLAAVSPIFARFPGVPVVLDHIGGAPTDEEPPFPRLSRVLDLASLPNVYVKLTPQPHKSQEPYPHPDTFDTYRRIHDAFGPQRLMWGTNFPGVLRGTGYVRALELFRTHLDFLTDDDRQWLFHRTAERVWRFSS